MKKILLALTICAMALSFLYHSEVKPTAVQNNIMLLSDSGHGSTW